MGLLPWRNFQAQHKTLPLKITTHRAAQFMSCMKDFKAPYVEYPSGNTSNVKVYIVVTQNFMQDK